MSTITNICDLALHRVKLAPDEVIYSYIKSDGDIPNHTYAQVSANAQRIGGHLQSLDLFQKPVLLLFSPGLDYIAAFLGCQFAGAIAVPAYAPADVDSWGRLYGIIEDAGIEHVLSTEKIIKRTASVLDFLPPHIKLSLIATDALPQDQDWARPNIGPNDIAFLQYTSGSTGKPKGVVVRHGNVMHNSELIKNCFGHSEKSRGVIWLPPYHDMGLIGGILQPLYVGFPVTLMSPFYFVQQPVRWLKAISDNRATTSGGPNFAFDLCVKKVKVEECEGFDLSSWDVAFNGGEPVKHSSLIAFARKFERFGFSLSAFLPCYGLAEGTLIVSGKTKQKPPATIWSDRRSLEAGAIANMEPAPDSQGVTLVSSGPPLNGVEIKICKNDAVCEMGTIGEICIRGDSVTSGYWHGRGGGNNPNEGLFVQVDGYQYLRTGDLGAIIDGELYVTGRMKDLIIVNGKNIYPQDVEAVAEAVHPGIRPNCTAFFSTGMYDDQLCLLLEVDAALSDKDVKTIRQEATVQILARFGVAPRNVCCVQVYSLPKTSSGKIQRYLCREMYLRGELKEHIPIN